MERDMGDLCALLGADKTETKIPKENAMWHKRETYGLPDTDTAQLDINWDLFPVASGTATQSLAPTSSSS